jgi:hypothetical protein
VTDEPASAPQPVPASDTTPVAELRGAAATPEERLAEILTDDPEVGSDGTGMGELP